MIPLRLVIDTNLISAALNPEGLRRTRPFSPSTARGWFLECADAARADYLVTGNQRHFPRFWKQTKVITSREFIGVVAPHLIA